MKAVIYARYSSDNQREESIEGQIRECTEYAVRNDITILSSYIDRALSARTADRPEFQRMIADSEKGLFDVVLVWKLDRFSRDRYDSAHYKHILKKNGVRVISARENISEGLEGIILESMLEGYAEYYSAELSEKIQRGQKENALKCRSNGGNIPLGYVVGTDGVLAVDPLTAPLVAVNRIADAIVALQDKEDTTIPALREQLKECEKGIENMLNAIQMGILTASTKTRLEELEARQNELKLSIMQAELQKPKYTKEQIVSWINRFKYGDVNDIEYQKQIIDTFINAIYIFDDKLVFTYNFKDGTEAIPLKAVEDSFGSDLTQVAPPNPRNPNIIPVGDGFGFLLFISSIVV